MNRVKNGVFLVRKWSYTTFNIVNIRKMWGKRSSEIFTLKMEIFTLKMEIFPEIGPRKNFWSPPKSAPGLRPCSELRTPASATAPGREGDYSGLANVRCSIMVGIYISQGSGQSRTACM